MKTLYRYRRTGESLDFTIEEIKGKLWCSAPKYLNDPFDGIGFAEPVIVNVPFNTTGDPLMAHLPNPYFVPNTLYSFVACFSEKWNNPPMWAHYSQFQGVCFGYDFEKLSEYVRKKKVFGLQQRGLLYEVELNKVKYKKEFPVSVDNPSHFIKTNDWDYEEEWRIVVKGGDTDTPGLIIKTHDCLSEITIGHQTNELTTNTIFNVVKETGRNIPIYKSKIISGKAGYYRDLLPSLDSNIK
ncbi:MAG TPA: DUF2971 domain-containing protein [Pyrinomonadaceae bacterium]|nr:DUF2971 domain-containing protein [Pyrinomonadaceae bacterium]